MSSLCAIVVIRFPSDGAIDNRPIDPVSCESSERLFSRPNQGKRDRLRLVICTFEVYTETTAHPVLLAVVGPTSIELNVPHGSRHGVEAAR